MIRSLAFTKASAIYHQITDHSPGACICPVSNTPLSTLVDPVIAPALFYDPNSESQKSVAGITSLLETSSVVKDGVDEHDLNAANFTSLAAESIRRTVYLTRSVALPVINDITDEAEDILNNVTGGKGLALNIFSDTKSGILTNPALVNAVDPYTRVANSKTDTVNHHDPRDSAQLLELMKVGYDDFDKDVSEWIAAHFSSDMVTSIYNDVFCTSGTQKSIGNVFDSHGNYYPEAIVCFLLARGLSLNPDENINMSAANYDHAMSMVINYAAFTIKEGIRRYKLMDSNDCVVLRFPNRGEEYSYDNPEKGVILVNKKSYDRFLEQGGSPEAIMGSYLLDQKTDIADIIESRDRYVGHYNARVLKERSDYQLKTIISMRRNVERLIADQIALSGRDLDTESTPSHWKGITLDQVGAQQRLRAGIDNMTLESLNNLYGTIRDIVLSVFFVGTDVKKVIDLIDANSKHEDDIKVSVNVAIVDYIVDWFMHQTQLVTE